jgi:sulfoxide reductase heme-binding subunit YedZ
MTLALAAASPKAYWYLTRGTGAVALVLLTASVLLGVLGSLRFSAGPRWPRFAIETLHRDVSLLVMVVLAVHIVTSVLDSFAPISVLNAVIPFTGTYRPLWLGFGALSFDLLVALAATSLVRRRLGYRAWRSIHWLAYASWPVAVLHGLGTGSDTKVWWMLALTGVCVVTVLMAVWARVAQAGADVGWVRLPARALTVLTPLGLLLFTLIGPLQSGWARKAGTPTKLLAKSVVPARAVVGSARPKSATATRAAAATRSAAATRAAAHTPTRSFSGQLKGTVSQTTVAGGALIDMSMRLSGTRTGRLRVRLAGAPIDGGGLSLTGSQVDLIADGLPSVMDGKVVSLQGTEFVAHLTGSAGVAIDVRANLNINAQTNAVTGTLAATPTGRGG